MIISAIIGGCFGSLITINRLQKATKLGLKVRLLILDPEEKYAQFEKQYDAIFAKFDKCLRKINK
jgi:hypothetical protein